MLYAIQATETIESKITNVLAVYPGISLSMMHYALNMRSSEWRPTFEKMLRKGQIIKVVIEFADSVMRPCHKLFNKEDVDTYEKIIIGYHGFTIANK